MNNKNNNYNEEQLNYSLTYNDVVRIMKMIDDHNYSSLNIELGDLKLEVNKENGFSSTKNVVVQKTVSNENEQEKVVMAFAENGASPLKDEEKIVLEKGESKAYTEEEGFVSVKTNITGVFYESSSPGTPPFVTVGSRVEKGDELGLIEVMKLFNSLTAPCAGVVKEVIVANESIVETGQVVMVIDPA